MTPEDIRAINVSVDSSERAISVEETRLRLLREGVAQLAELNQKLEKLMGRSIFEQAFGG